MVLPNKIVCYHRKFASWLGTYRFHEQLYIKLRPDSCQCILHSTLVKDLDCCWVQCSHWGKCFQLTRLTKSAASLPGLLSLPAVSQLTRSAVSLLGHSDTNETKQYFLVPWFFANFSAILLIVLRAGFGTGWRSRREKQLLAKAKNFGSTFVRACLK